MGKDQGVKASSAHRALRVLKLLKGHTLNGLSNGEIAKALDETPVNITRAMAVLQDEGLVAKLETGRWAHSISLLQIAQAHAYAMTQAQDRILELNRRIAAGAM